MSSIGLIIKREYLHRVSKKSFLLLTFFTPFLFAALLFGTLWLSTFKGDEVRTIAVIDVTGKYAPLLNDTYNYHFINSDKTLESYRQSPDKGVFAILNITGDLLQNPNKAAIYSEKQIPAELRALIDNAITKQLENEKLASFNIPNLKEIISESRINFNVNAIKWGEDGSENSSSATVASAIGVILTLIVYMFIFMYGNMVMQGVTEEKTNRIVEVMISSVRPFDLMMGKIIGIGFVGLTQIFLWGILTTVLTGISQFLFFGANNEALTAGALATTTLPGAAANLQAAPASQLFNMLNTINFTEIGIFFIIYFIGGYLLYGAIFAAIGSAVDTQEDTQQFLTPIMIFMSFALYAGIYSMENPDGPLAFWCSMIPLTSPIVMMIRLPFEIPMWEKLLSVVLLYGTAFGTVWFSAKIYRIGILMYGKKPSVKEILKWIRYK